MSTLVLLRHGQSQWNLENRFTGWWDVPLSDVGEDEARSAGRLLAAEGLNIDIVYTSVLTRAIQTADIALGELGRLWVPVKRHWRLNERHYGGLTGLDKKDTFDKYGEEQYMTWRRSFDTPPPPMPADSPYSVLDDPRYRNLAPGVVPATECLADVIDRMLPYWYDVMAPDLLAGATLLVAAHGNSMRALIKHLDGVSDEAITELELPTGVPIVYELDHQLRPTIPGGQALGDPEVIAAAAEAVRNQGR
ncbi:MAG: 2,3-diphosphoglycerate-dependent phosphoglycerate mutase [Acidimicrobiaceae bacterium]|nr:2,3-diphosphoglycerate-dependent phosphoglycerate mutase [Acidimicrobiaceae bacterium]